MKHLKKFNENFDSTDIIMDYFIDLLDDDLYVKPYPPSQFDGRKSKNVDENKFMVIVITSKPSEGKVGTSTHLTKENTSSIVDCCKRLNSEHSVWIQIIFSEQYNDDWVTETFSFDVRKESIKDDVLGYLESDVPKDADSMYVRIIVCLG